MPSEPSVPAVVYVDERGRPIVDSRGNFIVSHRTATDSNKKDSN
jgi:hypothetical protein